MKNRIMILLFVVLLVIAVLSGCLEEKSEVKITPVKTDNLGEVIYKNLTIEDLGLTINNYPRTDSSTSAYPLNYMAACNILNASYFWIELYGYQRDLAIFSNDTNISGFIESINYSGTHDAYINLIDGKVDLVLEARLPSNDELIYAKNNSVALIAKPIALDAFVFITNVANPVNSLTIQQIQDIYTGAITNWSQVDGNPVDIIAYQREKNSGSQELMETLVMKDLTMMDNNMLLLFGMSGPFESLSWDNEGRGIAYTVYYYKEFLTNTPDNIKMLGVNGVIPSYENISNREYELTTEVYTVIRSDLNNESKAYMLRDWLLGSEGQTVVNESGYVPI